MTPLSVTALHWLGFALRRGGLFLRGQDDGQKIRNKIRY